MAKAYFIKGAQYIRFDVPDNRVDSGYPKAIAGNWKRMGELGFGDGIDAAVNWTGGKVYFFKGDQYVRYDIAGNRVDDGYPLSITENWPGLGDAGFGDGIDATLDLGDGSALFFRRDQCLRYGPGDTVSEGPAPIQAFFWNLAGTGFEFGVSAAIRWDAAKGYLFEGDQYVRVDLAGRVMDEGYPAKIADWWPGFGAAGFGDGLSAAWINTAASGGGGGGGSADTSDLSDGFFTAIREVAGRLGCPPKDLLAVLFSESGCRATAHNQHGDASGILQFMPPTLVNMGWTQGHEAFRQLTAEQQVPYAEKFFAPHIPKGMTSAQRLHWAAFVPAGLSATDDPNHVVAGRDGPFSSAYNANPALDLNGDGVITLGELHDWTWQQCRGARWDDIVRRLGD